MASVEDGRYPEQIPLPQDILYAPAALPEPPPKEERAATPQALHNLAAIIEDIQASAYEPDPKARTRELFYTPEQHVIVSGYLPGQGEDLHSHPTRNTLLFLTGTFDFWSVNQSGEEEHHEIYPGMMVALDRGQPHRIQAKENQEGLSIVMVSIIEGMTTDTPGYSVPVHLPPLL